MTSRRAAAHERAESPVGRDKPRGGGFDIDPGLAIAAGVDADLADPYEAFGATVTLHQLARWLPSEPTPVLDVSLPLTQYLYGHDYRVSDIVAAAGHQALTVARAVGDLPSGPVPHPTVAADPRSLPWVKDGSFGGVVAEGAALSACLAAEDTVYDIARILRPGGRLLASADSLVHGLASLAEQHRWPELADTRDADVVLVPDPDHADAITRCFAPDELRELLELAGLEVEWIRPRTVLPAAAVRETLLADQNALGDLVASELQLAEAHEGESLGAQLVVSARKPG